MRYSLTVCLIILHLITEGTSFPGPPLPDIDTCTPRGGTCVNDTSICVGFTDTWALCRNSWTCCKPAPSTTHPEPPQPDTDICGKVTRIKIKHFLQTSRIVGGQFAEEGEWPWMVSLDDADGHFCGGTLISNQWIVTAAHCLERKVIPEVNLTLGEHHKVVMTGNEELVQIDTWIMHPDYIANVPGIPYDIALIRLVHPVDISDHYIRTACLPISNLTNIDDINSDCYISGWGSTRGTADRRHLQHLNVSIMSTASCNKSWEGDILDSHICAGNGNTGSCQGDSGGPLVCNISGQFVLYGVTSWGDRSCKAIGFPDIYTKVASYLPWIEKVIETHNDVEQNLGEIMGSFIRKILDIIVDFLKKSVESFTANK
ncbi:Anionic trypsin-2 [Mytilus coruscus]|uniref:Anionic trypsin-2 n=1 Tax=Mytilus coruscus TaxID=42192 RepID=A0A6J8C1X5_MYTCO|nr:Anionic trypsin-2 [Mytilus coruscus]